MKDLRFPAWQDMIHVASFRRWCPPSLFPGFPIPASQLEPGTAPQGTSTQIQTPYHPWFQHSRWQPDTGSPMLPGGTAPKVKPGSQNIWWKTRLVLTISSSPLSLQKCKSLMENMFSINWLGKWSQIFPIISKLFRFPSVSSQAQLSGFRTRFRSFTLHRDLLFPGLSSEGFKLCNQHGVREPSARHWRGLAQECLHPWKPGCSMAQKTRTKRRFPLFVLLEPQMLHSSGT